MFELIDYKEEESSDGYSGQVDYYYKLRNIETKEEKWVGKSEYKNIKAQRLLIS